MMGWVYARVRVEWRHGAAVIVSGVLSLLVGCGVSNHALKVEHPYVPLVQDEGDDTVTIARLAADAAVKAEYSLRYTVAVTASAGRYVLAAKDLAGGRYYAATRESVVRVAYSGATVLGGSKPEVTKGGIHIDVQGRAALYWFWDASYTDQTVMLAAPNLNVAISTEIDQNRRRARLEREERERIAGDAERVARDRETAEAARKKAQLAALAAALEAARAKDRVQCAGEQCDRDFARAQAYLLSQADMRIQVATPTLIETYNATEDGQLQMRLLKVPTTGDRWEVVLSAHCRQERKQWEELCSKKLLDVYGGFLPHMRR